MLQRILNSYTAGDELEVRYYIDPRAARRDAPRYHSSAETVIRKIVANLAAKKPSVTKFVDVQLGDLRKRITFGAIRTETVVRKTRKLDYCETNEFGGFKVALATETAVDPTSFNRVDRITAKYRTSYMIDNMWRLDVSAVKFAALATVQDTKTKLIACTDPFAIWGFWDIWEFELEHIGSSIELTAEMVLATVYQQYKYLAPEVNYSLHMEIARIAALIEHPQAEQFQKLSARNTIVRLLPKAVEPTLERYTEEFIYNLKGVVLRDKIDGVRELVIIENGVFRCIGVKTIDILTDCTISDAETYIFDTEYYEPTETWYILHVLMWAGVACNELSDTDAIELVDPEFLAAIPELKVCPFLTIENAAREIPAWWARECPYRRDGLILDNIKWKPAEESTVDMLVTRCPTWLEGKHPFVASEGATLYLLNVGSGSRANIASFPMKRYLDSLGLANAAYAPQPFSPADEPYAYVWESTHANLHGEIGEFKYMTNNHTWELRRIRYDKFSILKTGTEIGNDITTAMDIWSKNTHPFPLERLYLVAEAPTAGFHELQYSVAKIIESLKSEAKTPLVAQHMCGFTLALRTKYAILTPPRDARLAAYQLDSYPSYAQIVKYKQIGRITLPPEFIGGADILITMDPEISAHVSCIAKAVRPGGVLVAICRTEAGDDEHPQISRETLFRHVERANFALLEEHGAPETDEWNLSTRFEKFRIFSFRKENRGGSEMSAADIARENPHLAANPAAAFTYKFMRSKTKDMNSTDGLLRDSYCSSLRVDPARGRLLVIVEFLAGLPPATQVALFSDRAATIAALFPELQFVASDTATAATTEVVVYDLNADQHSNHAKTYHKTIATLDTLAPKSGLIFIDHHTIANIKPAGVLKGRFMFIPYDVPGSSAVGLIFDRRDTWHITPEIFEKEMQTFHKVYRSSCFKHAVVAPYDNCYDCRAEMFIMAKYARSQRLTIDAALLRFCAPTI
jgi:hypothetical protein